MGISIEDILQGHGIGSGGSGGVSVVKSETEPVAGLVDGLFWYNPVKEETKMYLNGEFRDIGGGGSIVTPIFGQATTATVTNEVAIPVLNYVPGEDVLLASQNGTVITESVDFTVDKATKKIMKVSGEWDTNTHFTFTVLATTPTGRADNVSLFQMEDHVTVGSGVQNITFAIPAYNPLFDILRVHQRNLEIFKNVDWTLNPDGKSIALTYALTDSEEFHFTVYKKIRDNAPVGSVDGSLLLPNSVAEDKLNFVPVKAEDVVIIDQKMATHSKGDTVGAHKATNISFTPPVGMTSTDVQAAVNEVFQSGNSRKNEIVDALLSIEPSLQITHSSTWSEIEAAIQNFSVGGIKIPGGTQLHTNGRIITGIDKGGKIYCTELNGAYRKGTIYDANLTLLSEYTVEAAKNVIGISEFGYAKTDPVGAGVVSLYNLNKTLLASDIPTENRASIAIVREGEVAYNGQSTKAITRVSNFSGVKLFENISVADSWASTIFLNKKKNLVCLHSYNNQFMEIFKRDNGGITTTLTAINGNSIMPAALDFTNW